MVWLDAFRERLRLSLWFVPGVLAICAAILAVALIRVDRRLSGDPGWLVFAFGGTGEGARAVLSVIATSMLTFTGLVFSITMLVLQLASSQLSPRVMRTFLRDRGNQLALGIFVATFVYTLVVLHEVRAPTETDEGFVPSLSIWVAFALLFGLLIDRRLRARLDDLMSIAPEHRQPVLRRELALLGGGVDDAETGTASRQASPR